eukprot:COSAG06_NODE_2164_length_7436_cov_5.989778_2_plen_74_part_00
MSPSRYNGFSTAAQVASQRNMHNAEALPGEVEAAVVADRVRPPAEHKLAATAQAPEQLQAAVRPDAALRERRL